MMRSRRNQSVEMSFVPNQSYILVKATDISSFTSQMRKTSVPTFEQIKLRANWDVSPTGSSYVTLITQRAYFSV